MPDTIPKAIFFLLGFGFMLTALTPPAHPEPLLADGASHPEIARLEAALSDAVNRFRSEHNLIPLARRPDLDAVARAHSRDMASRGYLAHESPEGRNWVDRLGLAGVQGFAMAGENVGLTSRQDPNREILSGWIASKVHRDNLMARPYNASGIGVARAADGSLYYTQLYVTFPR